jgi:excisionase family DNA binding protein
MRSERDSKDTIFLRFDDLPDVLTAVEAAGVLRLGRNTIYECLRAGTIPSVKVGRRLLIPKAALIKLLEEEQKAA